MSEDRTDSTFVSDRYRDFQVFVSYRFTDASAKTVVGLLDKRINGKKLHDESAGDPLTTRVQLVYDQIAPAGGRLPDELRARVAAADCLIHVASESVNSVPEGERDWIAEELAWWAEENEDNPPVVIEVKSPGSLRYVHAAFRNTWPDTATIPFAVDEIRRYSAEERRNALEALDTALIRAFKSSELRMLRIRSEKYARLSHSLASSLRDRTEELAEALKGNDSRVRGARQRIEQLESELANKQDAVGQRDKKIYELGEENSRINAERARVRRENRTLRAGLKAPTWVMWLGYASGIVASLLAWQFYHQYRTAEEWRSATDVGAHKEEFVALVDSLHETWTSVATSLRRDSKLVRDEIKKSTAEAVISLNEARDSAKVAATDVDLTRLQRAFEGHRTALDTQMKTSMDSQLTRLSEEGRKIVERMTAEFSQSRASNLDEVAQRMILASALDDTSRDRLGPMVRELSTSGFDAREDIALRKFYMFGAWRERILPRDYQWLADALWVISGERPDADSLRTWDKALERICGRATAKIRESAPESRYASNAAELSYVHWASDDADKKLFGNSRLEIDITSAGAVALAFDKCRQLALEQQRGAATTPWD